MRASTTLLFALLLSAPARAGELPEDVKTLLERYASAWEARSAPRLLELAPEGAEIFESLLDDPSFDEIKEISVILGEPELRDHEAIAGARVLSFTKTQEDVHWMGTVTRGIARIESLVAPATPSGELLMLSHRVVPLPGKPEAPYKPGEPSTWGPEREAAEKDFHEAHSLLLHGRVAQARERFSRIVRALEASADGALIPLRSGPLRFSAQACYFAALCEIRLGDRARGEELLQRAARYEPDFPLVLNLLAQRAAERGDLAGATALWRRSLDFHSAQPEIAHALDFHEKALAHYPAPELRARFLSVRSMPPVRAAETLAELAKSSVGEPETRRRLAMALLEAHQPDKARLTLQHNRYMHPTDPETRYLLARAHIALGRHDDAASLLRQLAEQNPGFRDTETQLASLYQKQGRQADAEGVLREALRRSPEQPELLFRMARLALKRGARSEARDFLQRAASCHAPAPLRRAIRDELQAL